MRHHGDRHGQRPDDGGRRRPQRVRRIGEIIPPATPYARTHRVGEVTVVELRGEIDVGSAEFVAGHLDAAVLWPPPLVVVLDLRHLEFIDCYGLSLLLRARRRVRGRGGTLRMACDHPPTRRLLALTGLDGVFRPFSTLEAALADPG